MTHPDSKSSGFLFPKRTGRAMTLKFAQFFDVLITLRVTRDSCEIISGYK